MPGRRKAPFWLWVAPVLAWALLLTACGGGGSSGGGSEPPLTSTVIQGKVQITSGSAGLPLRGASATLMAYIEQTPVTTGTLNLVRVNNSGVQVEVLSSGIALAADGSFSVTAPPAVFGQTTLVLSHSNGLRAVVTRPAGQTVDPVSTLAFRQAVLGGLDVVNTRAVELYEQAVTEIWKTRLLANVSDRDNDFGDLNNAVSALQHLAASNQIYFPGSAGAFCTSGTRVWMSMGDSRAGSMGEACLSGAFLSVREQLIPLSAGVELKPMFGDIMAVAGSPSHNLSVIHATHFRRLRFLHLQENLETKTDPQDVLLLSGTRAYASFASSVEFLLFDPTQVAYEAAKINKIDFSDAVSQDDLDGLPEMGRMVKSGDMVYMTLRHIDSSQNNAVVSPSTLAVINSLQHTRVDFEPITNSQDLGLPGRNCQPQSALGGKLYLACPGFMFPPAAMSASPNLSSDGLLAVDLTTFGVTRLIDQSVVNKKVMELITVTAERSYVRLLDPVTGIVSIVPVNLNTGAMNAPVKEGAITAFGVDAAGRLWFGERTYKGGKITVYGSDGALAAPFPVETSVRVRQFLFSTQVPL